MAAKTRRTGPPREWPEVHLLRVVMRANAALRDHHRRHFQDQDIGMVEFDFLAALGNTKGLRMRDLAHAMITTPSNVTRVCVDMETRGLAVRERSPESDREVIARLTPAGEKLFAKVFLETANWSADLIDGAMPDREDQRHAAELLDQLLAGLKRQLG